MILLLGLIFLAGIGLAVYGLFAPVEPKTQKKPKRIQPKDITGDRQEDYPPEQKLRWQQQIDSLQSELEKLKLEYTNLQKELEEAKKNEAKLQAEVARREGWVSKDDEALKKLQERYAEAEKQFLQKQKELEAEFSKNVDLSRQLREAKDKIKLLEDDIKQKADQIEALKHQVEKQSEDAKKHAAVAEELKKKEEISEWVPKTEFNKLNDEYIQLEKELEKKDVRIQKLTEEIINLNNQLKEKEEKPKEDKAES